MECHAWLKSVENFHKRNHQAAHLRARVLDKVCEKLQQKRKNQSNRKFVAGTRRRRDTRQDVECRSCPPNDASAHVFASAHLKPVKSSNKTHCPELISVRVVAEGQSYRTLTSTRTNTSKDAIRHKTKHTHTTTAHDKQHANNQPTNQQTNTRPSKRTSEKHSAKNTTHTHAHAHTHTHAFMPNKSRIVDFTRSRFFQSKVESCEGAVRVFVCMWVGGVGGLFVWRGWRRAPIKYLVKRPSSTRTMPKATIDQSQTLSLLYYTILFRSVSICTRKWYFERLFSECNWEHTFVQCSFTCTHLA